MLIRSLLALLPVLTGWLSSVATAQVNARPEPLPVEAVLGLDEHISRSRLDLSPDGEWLTHVFLETDVAMEALPSSYFSATGVPFTDGQGRMQQRLTHTETGEVVDLGKAGRSSWGGVWSPDGERLAYYCDCDGEAGVWIWERESGASRRFPGVIVRQFGNLELPAWAADSRRLLVKILPEGMSLAEANALWPPPIGKEGPRFAPVGADEPSVFVLRAETESQATGTSDTEANEDGDAEESAPEIEDSAFTRALRITDLALLDLETGTVQRLVRAENVSWWAFSPDQSFVAYLAIKGILRNTQQAVAELGVVEPATGQRRVLVSDFPIYTSKNVSWSPDSRRLAYRASDIYGKSRGEVFVVPVTGGGPRRVGTESFPGQSEWPPYWDAGGTYLVLPKDESLWRLEVDTGEAAEVARLPGRDLGDIVAEPDASTYWSPDGGRSLVIGTVEDEEGGARRSGFFQIDLTNGETRRLVEEARSYATRFGQDVVAGEIVFTAEDAQHPAEAWGLDVTTGRTRRLTSLNPQLDRFRLGEVRRITWTDARGETLQGTLLLPPDHDSDTRHPLVVWVYGDARGSEYVHRFALGWGGMPTFNFHLLSTRGYAVFFPDAPQREGTPMRDLYDTVMPGVDRLVELGIADPERLAVMGQSYGSYSTLALITQTRRFAAAVITAVLHPDLVSAYLDMAPDGTAAWTGYFEHGQAKLGGTPWEQRERYIQNSPIYRFDRIETPLLIGHGADDILPQRGPEAVFVALRRLGREVEYRLYEGEEHVIQHPPNVIDFWQRRLEFLAEHLDLTYDVRGAIVFDGPHARSRRANADELD